ncbi:fumarylacetoacetase [Verticiella sediminum]|uniref:fumarylacetoacetase n=1 Tax=Verticiella sediminum TaxID=1247510 RepID=A0A556ACI0_9BURK|nr:fumarylacetoacetase [Verticiella sediminum]TSH90591.1 fumarylacetoacetase [Verticiella sediminum]
MSPLNATHDGDARSWLDTANAAGTDFPIQNLPFGVFRRQGTNEAFRGGVAIGDQVICLGALAASGALQGLAGEAAQAGAQPTLNALMAQGPQAWRALRQALFDALLAGSNSAATDAVKAALMPLAQIEHTVPARIGDYTDFYTSIDHARNVGMLARPDEPLTPNFQWIPIAYHGRVSSIGVSGQRYRRPLGQSMRPGETVPRYGPCARLDYELELAIWIGQGNAQGEPIALAQADDHIFGYGLLNDWSARDIQFWEMAPLGPFLGKNFCTTISPWIVTQEALAPYRLPFERPAAEPQPLAYLDDPRTRREGALSIELDVLIESQRMREQRLAPSRVSHTNFRHQYWTVGQMVAQHTNGGCNLNPGDLFGSGTISGPTHEQAGALIELSRGGSTPVLLESSGETRAFLEDGDAVILRGWCEKPGYARIGFGESRGEVLPAVSV